MAWLPGLLVAFLLAAPADDYLADAQKALDANQPAAAEPLLRKAIEADPASYAAHFNLALSLSLQHKDPEAVSEYRKTLELKP
ncbi:MAG TPA: tetratricopeptide repeat protein, partial [Bryobacteraceae bacterium]|nr:tetratricopeptide repeat protein [Bryobacteraceae bacterium]